MQVLIRLTMAALLVLTVLWVGSQVSTVQQQQEVIPETNPLEDEYKSSKPTQSIQPDMADISHTPSATPSPSVGRKKRPFITDLLPSYQKDTSSPQWAIDNMLDTTQTPIDGVIVVGRLKFERPDWLINELADWRHAIYTRDDRRHPLSIPKNKGKASTVYLQYIIDHYHHLPATIVFLHNHRKPGHTEFRDYGNVAAVTFLRRDFVQKNGFANLRCTTSSSSGSSSNDECGNVIHPVSEANETSAQVTTIEHEYPVIWKTVFNSTDVPEKIATPYCGQFAVSREQVHKRPREEYMRYQQWVMETKLKDEEIEQVMGSLWHVIFGREAV
ncbi:DUF3431 domain-containing protein [Aspergillus vadensis CBS 113365]|uniref:Uncharacterized protein n=1 Tax=Aspergillus vadensis (strain CBS 113365 / IMI 142717 / IBT 24658) TaxID=1448311 RepID=A0A319AXF6_ASPVC|nr:hypothetical protein BO88DRAFT_408003 [Aspergillus vadensis CBS 113365]PYH65056.1 hypothetical protein BO88DRAFT_408003 [Aspergillus vadensis CBS 113365]